MEPQELLSPSVPDGCDIYIGLITSDYQVRIRGGAYMGFDNASWDGFHVWDLLFQPKGRGNPRVDVNHWNGDTIDGYMVGLKADSAQDHPRIQADWTEPRPMDYVLAAFALPKGATTQKMAADLLHKYGRVGISIEHGGRKPKRTIGPYVAICGNPWNLDAWMIYDRLGRYIYPNVLHYGKRKPQTRVMVMPGSVRSAADALLARVLQLPIKKRPSKFSLMP